MPKIGERAACDNCGHDIEWHGRKVGWIDRGAGRNCLPYEDHGEIVRPKGKHKPGK